jgi:hypothetical protein
MIVLVGIDDTDDASSRGTGYHARLLGNKFREEGIAEVHAITRHQLLIDSRIDYTSRNSSACMVIEPTQDDVAILLDFARLELQSTCAPGSNVGISLAAPSSVDGEIQDFSRAAKREFLSVDPALALAEQKDIYLEGLNGNGAGVIGALAALGLYASGDDGRFIWLPKLRDLDGIYTVDELTKLLDMEIKTTAGESLPPATRIRVSDWMRPIMREGHAILLAEQENQDGEISWRFVDKSTIKALSD